MLNVADTLVDPVAKAVGDLGEQIAKATTPLRRQARAATLSYLDEQKQRAAGEVTAIADMIRRSAQPNDGTAASALSGCAVGFADQIEDFAASLRERPTAAILADTETLARRQPALFLAGAVAVGFIIGALLASAGEPGGPQGTQP